MCICLPMVIPWQWVEGTKVMLLPLGIDGPLVCCCIQLLPTPHCPSLVSVRRQLSCVSKAAIVTCKQGRSYRRKIIQTVLSDAILAMSHGILKQLVMLL